MKYHWDWGGAGDLEDGSVPLSLSSSNDWVLTWLKKSVEKVVPQPVPSSRLAQSTAAGGEGPAQVLLRPEAEGGRVGGHCLWVLCPHLSVCPGRQEHRCLGNAALGAQVRPALQGWDRRTWDGPCRCREPTGGGRLCDWPWIAAWV